MNQSTITIMFQHCLENAKKDTREMTVTGTRARTAAKKVVKQNVHMVHIVLATMSQQFGSTAVLRYNCGEFHQYYKSIRNSCF